MNQQLAKQVTAPKFKVHYVALRNIFWLIDFFFFFFLMCKQTEDTNQP